MDEAGDDVSERETRLLKKHLDIPQRLFRLRLDALKQLLGRGSAPPWPARKTQSPRSSPGEYDVSVRPMRVFVISLLSLACGGI